MKRIALLLLALFAFATIAGARERKPKLPLRDEARLAAVKRVAVFAVYGPKEIDGGFGKNFEAQALYDLAETNLVEALKARGMEVLPLDATRALVANDYPAAYLQRIPEGQRKHLEAPQSRITKGISAIKAMKEGDHGFAAIDVVLVDTRGEVVYQDQLVAMSKETHGTGGRLQSEDEAGRHRAPDERRDGGGGAAAEGEPRRKVRVGPRSTTRQ